MYYKIKQCIDWFRYDFPYGIKNLIIWFPVVWKNRNWDHNYIYIILYHKLKLTEKAIRNGYHADREKDADKIKKCVLLLDRLIKDNYLENTMKKHDEKWGRGKLNFKPSKEDPEYHTLDIIYEHVKNKDDKEKQRKDFKIAVEAESQLREQDLDLLFKLLRKHIQTWWD